MFRMTVLFFIIGIPILAVFIFLIYSIIRALWKYIGSKDARKEKETIKVSLGETIKSHRMRCKMTQEFVADALGVSRQSVSKWENGTCDPSTSNLIALSKLFQISPEELLREIS